MFVGLFDILEYNSQSLFSYIMLKKWSGYSLLMEEHQSLNGHLQIWVSPSYKFSIVVAYVNVSPNSRKYVTL